MRYNPRYNPALPCSPQELKGKVERILNHNHFTGYKVIFYAAMDQLVLTASYGTHLYEVMTAQDDTPEFAQHEELYAVLENLAKSCGYKFRMNGDRFVFAPLAESELATSAAKKAQYGRRAMEAGIKIAGQHAHQKRPCSPDVLGEKIRAFCNKHGVMPPTVMSKPQLANLDVEVVDNMVFALYDTGRFWEIWNGHAEAPSGVSESGFVAEFETLLEDCGYYYESFTADGIDWQIIPQPVVYGSGQHAVAAAVMPPPMWKHQAALQGLTREEAERAKQAMFAQFAPPPPPPALGSPKSKKYAGTTRAGTYDPRKPRSNPRAGGRTLAELRDYFKLEERYGAKVAPIMVTKVGLQDGTTRPVLAEGFINIPAPAQEGQEGLNRWCEVMTTDGGRYFTSVDNVTKSEKNPKELCLNLGFNHTDVYYVFVKLTDRTNRGPEFAELRTY